MNMEQTFTVLRREQLLIYHAPHSVQFQDLTDSLLRVCSAAAVIPALSALEIRLYSTLALLHDVGKRAIPLEILNKPGPLSKEEFAIMKSHTTQGCDLLERIPELRECEAFPAICDVCRHHHERWDGAGYPARLAGEEITPLVQVVGLAPADLRSARLTAQWEKRLGDIAQGKEQEKQFVDEMRRFAARLASSLS